MLYFATWETAQPPLVGEGGDISNGLPKNERMYVLDERKGQNIALKRKRKGVREFPRRCLPLASLLHGAQHDT